MSTTKQKVAGRMKGYQSRDAGTHRTYNFRASIERYKKTGKIYKKNGGSGHRAGEKWGDNKDIDPESNVTRYSKNSPSFDEGVYLSKKKRKAQSELQKEGIATKMIN